MELVSEAIIFAVKAHDGMRRKKTNVPYILHPLEAASIVLGDATRYNSLYLNFSCSECACFIKDKGIAF